MRKSKKKSPVFSVAPNWKIPWQSSLVIWALRKKELKQKYRSAERDCLVTSQHWLALIDLSHPCYCLSLISEVVLVCVLKDKFPQCFRTCPTSQRPVLHVNILCSAPEWHEGKTFASFHWSIGSNSHSVFSLQYSPQVSKWIGSLSLILSDRL